MKKNIVIIILILISGTFAVYAQIKASDAAREAMMSELAMKEAEVQRNRAEQAAAEARKAEAEAVALQEYAENCAAELLECKSN